MVFTDIRLQNFRSYTDSSFDLSDKVTIIVGPNAAGKTNLLEAVLFNCIAKSYKSNALDLIKKGEAWARVDAHTSENSVRTSKIITNSQARPEKLTVIDDKEYKRLPIEKTQPVVLFEPNNLFLLQGEPAARREYLDNIIEQTTPGYSQIRANYRRILAQRNALLKNPKTTQDLFVWDIRLSELGEQIVSGRLKTTKLINKEAKDIYSKIAGKKTDVNIEYTSNIDQENYASKMLHKLQINITKDQQRGFTGTGPHRDDILITIEKSGISMPPSRGETRTALLALKIIELSLIENSRNTRPTLLLDDVFSELDGARRKALTEFLSDYQTIITTTDADIVSKNFSQNCQIIPL